MFCPRCGQEQISDELRFCSRCGFQLAGVSELLLNEGVMLAGSKEEPKIMSALRQKTALPGARIMFFSLCLLPVAIAIGIAVNGPAPLLAAVIPFFIGLVYMLYALAFGKQNLKLRHRAIQIISSTPPPHYVAPLISAETQPLMSPVQPPSVTDETTKLLKVDKEKSKLTDSSQY